MTELERMVERHWLLILALAVSLLCLCAVVQGLCRDLDQMEHSLAAVAARARRAEKGISGAREALNAETPPGAS